MVARAKCATLFEVTPLLGFDVNIIREIYVDVLSCIFSRRLSLSPTTMICFIIKSLWLNRFEHRLESVQSNFNSSQTIS